MRVVPIKEASEAQHEQATAVLVEALRHAPSAWHDMDSARTEVARFLEPDRLGWLAVETDEVVGWIGTIKHSPLLWEMHPLVVHPRHQGKGVGTVWLGADDDFGGTNLFGVDLYPNVLERLSKLQAARGHPYQFYQKMDYVVVGALPDANGPGKHDILMAKRIGAFSPEVP